MHSVIVAAYNCLIILLTKKPYLLRDKICLETVNNCIEIGISGSSSHPEQKLRDDSREGGAAVMKAEKELKPASLRVKEAAECVLCFIMEHTSLSSTLGITESSDLTRISLKEKSFLELTKNVGKFKYFAMEGALIIAVFEKPLFKPQSGVNICPTLTILLRGPFTCQAWSLHLRNSPFTKKIEVNREKELKLNNSNENFQNSTLKNPGLMLNSQETLLNKKVDSSSSDQPQKSVPKCEMSIPSLSYVANSCVKNLAKFQSIKEEQIKFEMAAVERVNFTFN